MRATWWQLPGPARFLDTIEDDLREGCNLTLSLPAGVAPGLRTALGARVQRSDLWLWRTVHLGEVAAAESDRPAELLHQRFAPQQQPGELLAARTLCVSERFRGYVIWVDGLAEEQWTAWRSFLERYAHACREVVEFDRSMLCVPLVGPLATLTPPQEIALRNRRWRGQVDRLDMALYLAQQFHDRPFSHLARRVAVAVAVELATSDVELAETLSDCELADLFQPLSRLQRLADQRCWSSGNNAATWERGMLDDFEGVATEHSAALAAEGRRDELTSRVWKGQVTALFPFIEEQRLRVLGRLRGHLRVPMETPFGVVTDVRDLEIGQILYQLHGARVSQQLYRLLRVLKQVRDALAHLQPIDVETLADLESLSLS